MDCRYLAGKTWLNNVERDYQTYRLCKSRLLKFKFIVYCGLRLHHACGNDIIAKLGSGIVRKSSRAIKAKINGSYLGSFIWLRAMNTLPVTRAGGSRNMPKPLTCSSIISLFSRNRWKSFHFQCLFEWNLTTLEQHLETWWSTWPDAMEIQDSSWAHESVSVWVFVL